MTGPASNAKLADLMSSHGDWSLRMAGRNDRPLTIVLRDDVAEASDKSSWPIKIGIALPVNRPEPSGLPGKEETTQFHAVDQLIRTSVGRRAVVVAVIAGDDMQEWLLYAYSGDWIEACHRELIDAVPTHNVQMYAREDHNWDTYWGLDDFDKPALQQACGSITR